jgi:hypothetical protein
MPNTVPPPPIEHRSTPELVETMCLELRHVGVGDYTLPDAPYTVAHIQSVQRIHAELEKRQVDVQERIAQLSTETKWQMDELLRDCLAFPKVIPYVKESDGIRRALRCNRCQQREMPDRKGIWLCDVCLAGALQSVESRTPEDGFVLFRTYNPSRWCEHSDADTVLIALDGGDWIDNGYCRICLSEEQQRRKRTATDASLDVGEAMDGAWEILTEAEMDTAWDRFYAEFNFRPSVHPQDWPGIKEPTPSTTYSISSFYRAMSNPRVLENDLNVKTLEALQKCVEPERRLYALDWQHNCYWLYPHRTFDAHRSGAWKVPVLPNGDYYIFLAEDFSFGLFGHPWEQTICVFGQVLLDALAQDMPLLFAKPIRKDGKLN